MAGSPPLASARATSRPAAAAPSRPVTHSVSPGRAPERVTGATPVGEAAEGGDADHEARRDDHVAAGDGHAVGLREGLHPVVEALHRFRADAAIGEGRRGRRGRRPGSRPSRRGRRGSRRAPCGRGPRRRSRPGMKWTSSTSMSRAATVAGEPARTAASSPMPRTTPGRRATRAAIRSMRSSSTVHPRWRRVVRWDGTAHYPSPGPATLVPDGSLSRFWDAVSVFAERLGGVEWRFLILGLAFHLLNLILRTRAWRNILQAAAPKVTVGWPGVFGSYMAGVGVNAVAPARGWRPGQALPRPSQEPEGGLPHGGLVAGGRDALRHAHGLPAPGVGVLHRQAPEPAGAARLVSLRVVVPGPPS